MNHIEQAIKEAVEKGGFRDYFILDGRIQPQSEVIFWKPSFWQALGKALGWYESKDNDFGHGWKWHWHRLIDHLAAGNDLESFFAALSP